MTPSCGVTDAKLASSPTPGRSDYGFDQPNVPILLGLGGAAGKEENWPVPSWTVDASMAIMLILLAAVEEGLGAWYLFISRGEDDVMRELGVPPSCKLLGVIALGYPSPEDKPRTAVFAKRRRAYEDMFHAGRWSRD